MNSNYLSVHICFKQVNVRYIYSKYNFQLLCTHAYVYSLNESCKKYSLYHHFLIHLLLLAYPVIASYAPHIPTCLPSYAPLLCPHVSPVSPMPPFMSLLRRLLCSPYAIMSYPCPHAPLSDWQKLSTTANQKWSISQPNLHKNPMYFHHLLEFC